MLGKRVYSSFTADPGKTQMQMLNTDCAIAPTHCKLQLCVQTVKCKLCTESLVGRPEETVTSHLMNFMGIIWDGDTQDEIP